MRPAFTFRMIVVLTVTMMFIGFVRCYTVKASKERIEVRPDWCKLIRLEPMTRYVNNRRGEGIWQIWQSFSDQTEYALSVEDPCKLDSAIGTVEKFLITR